MALSDIVYIDSTGYHYPDFPTFLDFFTTNYLAIYGADTDLDSDTQDGQWLAVQAQAAYDTISNAANTYNSFSPVTAQGVGLSRNVKINGLSRQIPSNSTVDLLVVGQSGTTITNGVAIDILQQKWNLPLTTIPGGGSITVTAVSDALGAIAAAANTVNQIFTPTLGWQTVNNTLPATLGAPVETDAQLRVRQQQSVADPSLTVFDGTIGGVENLSGVQKVQGYENPTASTDANGIPAHMICVIVKGGDDQSIANETALHKTPGTGTYGTGPGLVQETVYDSHGMPLIISFMRPTTVTIQIQVTLKALVGWTTDYEVTIASALAAQLNADAIGDDVILTKLYGTAYLLGTPAGLTFDITGIQIGKNGGSLGTSNIVLAFNEEAVVVPAVDVTFVVT